MYVKLSEVRQGDLYSDNRDGMTKLALGNPITVEGGVLIVPAVDCTAIGWDEDMPGYEIGTLDLIELRSLPDDLVTIHFREIAFRRSVPDDPRQAEELEILRLQKIAQNRRDTADEAEALYRAQIAKSLKAGTLGIKGAMRLTGWSRSACYQLKSGK